MDSRQLTEMYAFARMEPLDQPLQDMLAQLTDVLARVHGNETSPSDFLLVREAPQALDEGAARAQQIAELFQAASAKNSIH
ncbi:TPA: phage tail assembly protein T [Stenotrophomonas maltophilia]